MNFKKNWKRFWTLSSAREGFTLVELIVVIAILAILAGVAVPAYSGYVKKANMQADITLISEIEHALTLAGYNGTFNEGEGGYIILSVNGVEGVEEGSNLEKALIDTFGSGYADTLVLKYDGWGNSGVLPDAEKAYVVANSSYMTGNRQDVLLSDVEKMTSMAINLVDSLAAGGGVLSDTTLSGMFSYEDAEGNVVCVLDETAAKYGISKDANETWEEWAERTGNQTTYSNLLVLAAADESEKFYNSQGTYDMTGASDMILEFSSYYAFAATDPAFSEILNTYMDDLSNVTDKDSGKAWYNELKAAADAAGYDAYLSTKEEYGQAYVDEFGFLGILSSLGNPTEEQAANIAADITNANLFTSGTVNNMYSEYLDSVAAVNSLTNLGIVIPTLGQGEVAIVIGHKGGQFVIANTLPVN